MKRQIVIFFLFLSLLSYGQVHMDYSPSTNTVSALYTGCDPCLIDQNGVFICNCHRNCEIAVYEFLLNCLSTANGIIQIANCQTLSNLQEQSCKNTCGTLHEPIRVIYAYQYILTAVWDHIPFDPKNNQINRQSFNSGIIYSNNIIINNWNPSSPWPAIFNGHNTCYNDYLKVHYNNTDGSYDGYCDFTDWKCYIIG